MSIVAPRLTTRLPRPGRRGGPGGLAGLHKPSRLAYALLLAFIAGSAFPVYWTFVAASGTNEVIASTPPALLPGGHLFGNISRVFATTDFGLALRNSVIVSGTVTASVLLFSTLAGFAFAKMRFRGRDAALLLVIGTMMVPTQLGIIPLYILMNTLGLAGRLPAVILPFMVTGFGVFFMRQFISEAVPTSCWRRPGSTGRARSGRSGTSWCRPSGPRWPCSGCSRSSSSGTSSSGR
jgi:cellobiose transport system permease protein